MKKFDDAQKILEGVRERVPTLSVVHELLGGVYFLKGEKVQALDAFKRALALNPNSVDAINMSESISRSTAADASTGSPSTEVSNPSEGGNAQ
jgi:tetratricopeptide (TPR) repeat protein